MSTRRQRSRRRRQPATVADVMRGVRAGEPRAVAEVRRALDVQPVLMTREAMIATTTRQEAERRHLELVRPLLELAVAAASDNVWPDGVCDRALAAAVRIAGPCPAGWCRYPAGHTGDHDPLDAA